MTFEGEHKIIPITGIARAGADTMCADGAMNEVIGLEYKDGSYVPYCGAEVHDVLPNLLRNIYVHKTSYGNNVLIKCTNVTVAGVYKLMWISEDKFNKGEGRLEEEYTLICEDAILDVEFVGNVLCISTTTGVFNFIFQDGKYEKWQINKNLLPNISFRVDLGLAGKKSGSEDAVGVICLENGKYSSETSVSLLTKARGEVEKYGGLTGFFFVCAAYRLKTGEYIKASNPLLMCRPMHKFGNKFCNVKTGNSEFKSNSGSVYEPNIGDKGVVVYTQHVLEDVDYIPKYEGNSGSMGTINTLMIKGTSGAIDFSSTDVLYPPLSCCAQVNLQNDNYSRYIATVISNKLQYKIDKNINASEQLIDSLCIFMSQEIDPFLDLTDSAIDKNYLYSAAYSDSEVRDYRMVSAKLKPTDDIVKELSDVNSFYLVKEIYYDDIKKSNDWIDIELEGKLGNLLLTRETLPISAFDCSVFSSASFDSYNSRLHMYNYEQSEEIYLNIEDFNLQGGFGQIAPDSTRAYHAAYIIVDIEDANGKRRIVKYFENPMITSFFTGMDIAITPYVSFHHPYARKISIILKYYTSYYYLSYDLKKSRHGGYSYFIKSDLNALPIAAEYIDEDTVNSYIVPSNGDIRRNNLRVSDTYNVNNFPYANTYVVGNGEIIGMASLSIALSQDTFGSYPLLVFTTEGIYSLETDKTGSSAYTNIPPPFSREVCTNKNTICEIDGAVLFASSKGLMMASAQGVQEFLPMLNGEPKHLPTTDTSKGLGLDWYYKIIDDARSTKLLGSISEDDFIQYLNNNSTVVSYVSNKNKIIVYNQTKDFCYWIDIPTRVVTKLPIGISMDNNNYPTELYLLNNGKVLEFDYQSQNADVQCLLQSRPIKNTYGMKSTMRVIARGYFHSSNPNNYAVMLVLGSYDAINWQPIGVCQITFAGGFNDLGCVTDRVSCKYVMVIITGKMMPDSHIDGIEMTINNKYNNKLK